MTEPADESVSELKDRITALQQFILESDLSSPSTEQEKKIRQLERSLKLLTDELDTYKRNKHEEELRNRVTMQQKLLEIREEKDREVHEYQSQIARLQGTVYTLQEELLQHGITDISPKTFADEADDEEDENNTAEDDGHSKEALIAKLQLRVIELEKERHDIAATPYSSNNSTVKARRASGVLDLEFQVAELLELNVKLRGELDEVKARLDMTLSEKSELESLLNSPSQMTPKQSTSTSLSRLDSPQPQRLKPKQFCDLFFLGVIRRKQNSFPGRWLPRLILVDQELLEMWIAPETFKLSQHEQALRSKTKEERKLYLESLQCTFRRSVTLTAVAHANLKADNCIDVVVNNDHEKLFFMADSAEQQRQLVDAITASKNKESKF